MGGCISVIGFLFVANFPEYIMNWIHTAGAWTQFTFGLIYTYIDAEVTRRMVGPGFSPSWLYQLRCAAAILASILFASTFVTEVAAWMQWLEAIEAGLLPENATWLIYLPFYPGYTLHLVSAISEWMMALFFISYFLTFIYEFKRF